MSYPLTEEELKKIENHKIKVECVKALSYYEYGKKVGNTFLRAIKLFQNTPFSMLPSLLVTPDHIKCLEDYYPAQISSYSFIYRYNPSANAGS